MSAHLSFKILSVRLRQTRHPFVFSTDRGRWEPHKQMPRGRENLGESGGPLGGLPPGTVPAPIILQGNLGGFAHVSLRVISLLMLESSKSKLLISFQVLMF